MRPTTSGTTTSSEMKKKGNFRTLLSVFRRPSTSKSDLSSYPNDIHNSAASSVSTTFLPPEVQLPTASAEESSAVILQHESTASTVSLSTEGSSPFSRSPSTSSASTLSMDHGSDVSTPMTTPSNSSPCILMKASEGSGELALHENTNKGRQRALEALSSKQLSPLSTATDAVNQPYHAPTSSSPAEDTEEIRQQKAKKRRGSIGRMLIRRAKSNPDFVGPTDAEEAPPLPRTSRKGPQEHQMSISSTGSTHSGLSRRLSRRGSTKGIPGLDKDFIPDPIREKEEHLLILGADPMGSSFYLYPTSKQEVINRRKSTRGSSSSQLHPNRYSVHSDDKRRSWSGLNSDAAGSGLSGSSRRPRGGMRPAGSFRPTVANQVIMEEGNEAGEAPRMPVIPRRHSTLPGQYDNWRSQRFDSDLRPSTLTVRSESNPAPSAYTLATSVNAG